MYVYTSLPVNHLGLPLHPTTAQLPNRPQYQPLLHPALPGTQPSLHKLKCRAYLPALLPLSSLIPVREEVPVKSFSVGVVKLLRDLIPMLIVSCILYIMERKKKSMILINYLQARISCKCLWRSLSTIAPLRLSKIWSMLTRHLWMDDDLLMSLWSDERLILQESWRSALFFLVMRMPMLSKWCQKRRSSSRHKFHTSNVNA